MESKQEQIYRDMVYEIIAPNLGDLSYLELQKLFQMALHDVWVDKYSEVEL